ncbi:uncharacterized protein MKK02DRAFT_29816 [Dioszegia hungarica]|uniref:BZIP domain-containing protein n=1 Tax=Dioszegia hungarica TaxID=4972 RepID=A0AA38HI39_9TREE|nr:uncharacterized protein MKK02DRAFT_29816 [Dioszegia hungarica]KAI9639849.1 hypothetical protein MKK02DRAFT_29816 [Dioszegia hungarica]
MPDFAELEKQYHRCMTISAARVADQVRYLAQSGHPQPVHPAHGALVDPQPPSASIAILVSHPAPAHSPSADLGPGHNIIPLPGPFDHLLTSPAGPSSLLGRRLGATSTPYITDWQYRVGFDPSRSPATSSTYLSATYRDLPTSSIPITNSVRPFTLHFPYIARYKARRPSISCKLQRRARYRSQAVHEGVRGRTKSELSSNWGGSALSGRNNRRRTRLPCLPELVLPPNPTFPVFSQLPQLSAPLLGFTHPPILPTAPPHTPTRYIHDLDPVVNLAVDRGRLATFHLPNSRRRPSLPNTARDHVPEGEKWLDKKERRKAQNRIAQRRSREKGKEHGSGSSQSTMVSTPPSDERRFSGEDDSGDSSAGKAEMREKVPEVIQCMVGDRTWRLSGKARNRFLAVRHPALEDSNDCISRLGDYQLVHNMKLALRAPIAWAAGGGAAPSTARSRSGRSWLGGRHVPRHEASRAGDQSNADASNGEKQRRTARHSQAQLAAVGRLAPDLTQSLDLLRYSSFTRAMIR